jgi:hypothetical protein
MNGCEEGWSERPRTSRESITLAALSCPCLVTPISQPSLAQFIQTRYVLIATQSEVSFEGLKLLWFVHWKGLFCVGTKQHRASHRVSFWAPFSPISWLLLHFHRCVIHQYRSIFIYNRFIGLIVCVLLFWAVFGPLFCATWHDFRASGRFWAIHYPKRTNVATFSSWYLVILLYCLLLVYVMSCQHC